jgi:DNA-binding response OmpR family regulator
MTARKLRLLYCEDDADSREMMSLVLANEGFDLVCPDSAHGFLKFAKEESFDVYLLDNWMPDLSGYELCRQIRQFDSRAPIIFYSGASSPSDQDQAFAAGAQAYIIKPAPIDKVIATIRSTIEPSKAASA